MVGSGGAGQGRFWKSGGGFANYTFARPDYQAGAVARYLEAVAGALPPAAAFNGSGIGYADVVTLGDNMLVYWFGQLYPLGGTSSSGPAMAGLLALLNDARLHAGHGPLGYLNPVLYALHETHPEAFTDITVGGNNDGDIQPPGSPYPTFCPYGFPAAKGWCGPPGDGPGAKLNRWRRAACGRDPASGLGSLNMRVLTELLA